MQLPPRLVPAGAEAAVQYAAHPASFPAGPACSELRQALLLAAQLTRAHGRELGGYVGRLHRALHPAQHEAWGPGFDNEYPELEMQDSPLVASPAFSEDGSGASASASGSRSGSMGQPAAAPGSAVLHPALRCVLSPTTLRFADENTERRFLRWRSSRLARVRFYAWQGGGVRVFSCMPCTVGLPCPALPSSSCLLCSLCASTPCPASPCHLPTCRTGRRCGPAGPAGVPPGLLPDAPHGRLLARHARLLAARRAHRAGAAAAAAGQPVQALVQAAQVRVWGAAAPRSRGAARDARAAAACLLPRRRWCLLCQTTWRAHAPAVELPSSLPPHDPAHVPRLQGPAAQLHLPASGLPPGPRPARPPLRRPGGPVARPLRARRVAVVRGARRHPAGEAQGAHDVVSVRRPAGRSRARRRSRAHLAGRLAAPRLLPAPRRTAPLFLTCSLPLPLPAQVQFVGQCAMLAGGVALKALVQTACAGRLARLPGSLDPAPNAASHHCMLDGLSRWAGVDADVARRQGGRVAWQRKGALQDLTRRWARELLRSPPLHPTPTWLPSVGPPQAAAAVRGAALQPDLLHRAVGAAHLCQPHVSAAQHSAMKLPRR